MMLSPSLLILHDIHSIRDGLDLQLGMDGLVLAEQAHQYLRLTGRLCYRQPREAYRPFRRSLGKGVLQTVQPKLACDDRFRFE